MNDPKQDIILKLKEANNILVTVSANPSVDQLAAAIGLTILLNKLKKHATAVFSGAVPSTIDFLKPEDTIEKTTDSLRDFIIALDKSKADKLRYKVEENIVKIFITPYKTSITQDDLDFSQGDFNVDVVLALGVREQQELDQAITAHGRILHDATVISVNTQPGSQLGAINWAMPDASSLSELAVDIADGLAKDLMDSQIATALLTGIVAETERFSNEKTSPETMRLSSELMAAGANQQLVASELEQPEQVRENSTGDTSAAEASESPKPDDGTLEIAHSSGKSENTAAEPDATQPSEPESKPDAEPATDDDTSKENDQPKNDAQPGSAMPLLAPSELASPHHVLSQPEQSNPLTANIVPEDAGDFGSLPAREPELPILQRNEPASGEPPEGRIGLADSIPKPDELPELDLPTPVTTNNDSLPPPLPPAQDKQDTNDFLPLSSEPTVPTPPAPEPPAFDLNQAFSSPLNSPASQPDTGSSVAQPDPSPAPGMPADPLGAFPPLPAAAPLSTVSPTPPVDGTLTEIEKAVHSPHANQEPGAEASVDAARDAVMSAINSIPADDQPQPPQAAAGATGYLNVQDLPDVNNIPDTPAAPPLAIPEPQTPAPALPFSPAAQPVPYVPEPTPGNTPADTPLTMPLPPAMTASQQSQGLPLPPAPSSPAPPPVPPPMTDLPPFVNPNK